MTEVRLDFIAPYRLPDMSVQELQALLRYGVLAWNAALLSVEERRQAEAAFNRLMPENDGFLLGLVRNLVARKLAHFPDDMCRIENHRMVEDGRGGYHLTVTYVDEE